MVFKLVPEKYPARPCAELFTKANSPNQCEAEGPLLAGAGFAGADAFGAAGTSDFAAAGAAGTSDCCAAGDDAGALPFADTEIAGALATGADAAGAELPTPAMMPSVCCALGLTP